MVVEDNTLFLLKARSIFVNQVEPILFYTWNVHFYEEDKQTSLKELLHVIANKRLFKKKKKTHNEN